MKKESVKLKRYKHEDLTPNPHDDDPKPLGGVDRTPRAIKLGYFIAKLLLLSVLILATGFGIVTLHYPLKMVFIVGMGLLIAHATELVHQCLHRTAIGRATPDNLFGRLLGLPSGTSYWYYKWFHLWHHRFNGTELDKESFGYSYQLMEHPSRVRRIAGFFRHLSMAGHYTSAVRRMCLATVGKLDPELRRETPEMNPSTSRKIQHDYQIMGAALVAATLLSYVFQTYIVLELWLLPLIVSWGPVHALIELPEHWGCDRPAADVFVNTRSIRANRLARWFTNNNCNHVGHHYDMSVSMENLPAFEDVLSDEHPFKFHESTYFHFYLHFFKYLYTGQRRIAADNRNPSTSRWAERGESNRREERARKRSFLS